MNLGLSGRLTKATIRSPLTPLFLLAALAVGLLALLVIPREEEPQISVPMVDITVRADGLKAPDAVELVTKPLEAIVKAIDGVEHVYSQTVDDRVMVTARFFVGTKADDAILRVHEKIRANYDRIPVGIPEPLIVGRGINDVAIVVLTLAPKPAAAARYTDKDLYQIADELRAELTKIDDVGLSYVAGGSPEQIRVEPDPEKLSLFGVTLAQLIAKVRDANRSFLAGSVRDAGSMRTVAAGQTLDGIPDIGLLLVTTRDARPVYVRDVASVVIGPGPLEHRVWSDARGDDGGAWTRAPAVSLALAKRAGANAVVVAAHVLDRLDSLKGRLIPADVDVTVSRDYGETANEKANELLLHLGLATVSIVGLIAVAIGWREAVVTLVVIPTTILLTLFAANLMGYTINRVSLFALIFSIGILVDDAIVMVENIARHWAMPDGRPRLQAAVEAVAEVGNPTIVATLTVVAALLPMLFVSGLMGPYMAPIPANASAAMLFSFFIAVVVAPWLMLRLAPRAHLHGSATAAHHEGPLGRIYRRIAAPVLRSRRNAWIFLLTVGFATIAVCALFYLQQVTVKLLPFDNKSELAVVLDLAQGASLEDTERTLFAAADIVHGLPEVTSVQTYAGTPAPFNFNGLVRHYYSRESPELGDLQINLTARAARSRTSHAVALDLRGRLKGLTLPAGAVVKVVEVPPGPPVLATLLAEVYGPDPVTRRAVVGELKKIFSAVPFIVDVDDSIKQQRPRLRISIDEDRLEFFGVEQSDVYDTIQALLGGVSVGYSHRGEGRNPIEISVRLPKSVALLERIPRLLAGGGQYATRQQDRGRARRRRSRLAGAGLADHLPPRRPLCRHGDGRSRRRVRGADLRHARGRQTHRRARLGSPAETGHRVPRPARRRVEDHPAVGRRMGDHLCDLPRHGRGFRGGDRRHLHPGGGAVRQLQAAAGHPHPDPAHPDRHCARALAVGRAVHRDFDDRLHRARRNHRAQLDPAGRFHPPWIG